MQQLPQLHDIQFKQPPVVPRKAAGRVNHLITPPDDGMGLVLPPLMGPPISKQPHPAPPPDREGGMNPHDQ